MWLTEHNEKILASMLVFLIILPIQSIFYAENVDLFRRGQLIFFGTKEYGLC